MTPYQAHKQKWAGCERCPLSLGRRQVVFARGSIPCDVLFVGEAPGVSEDALGQPFVGPAGQLLDRIIHDAFQDTMLRVAFYNSVSCFPRDAKETPDHAPPLEAIKACSHKLKEFVGIAQPRLVVCVGSVAEKHIHLSVDTAGPIKVVSIVHPAAILRASVAQRGLMGQRASVILSDAIGDL